MWFYFYVVIAWLSAAMIFGVLIGAVIRRMGK